jgi:small-conductance mechanosensitive channel
MTLRMVRLRSQEGSFVLIPNGDIRAVKNFTTDWARVDFKYSVPLTADLDKATKIIFEEVERIKKTYAKDILGTPEIRPVEKIVDFENRSTAALFRVFIKTHSIASKLKIEMDLNKGVMSQHVSLLQNSLPSQKL